MAHCQELSVFLALAAFRIQREPVSISALLRNALCDLIWDSCPPLNLIFASEKIEDLISSSLSSLPSLICWESGILEIPKHQQHPGNHCSLLTSPDQRAEEGGKACMWLQPEASVPEIFRVQIILKITRQGLFLTKQCCVAISRGVNWGIRLALC